MADIAVIDNKAALNEYDVFRRNVGGGYSVARVFAASESEAVELADHNELRLDWKIRSGLNPDHTKTMWGEIV